MPSYIGGYIALLNCFFENLPVLPYRLHLSSRSSPLREEEGNRPTRCSKPLRSKVGGPSKVFAMVVRDGTAWDGLAIMDL